MASVQPWCSINTGSTPKTYDNSCDRIHCAMEGKVIVCVQPWCKLEQDAQKSVKKFFGIRYSVPRKVRRSTSVPFLAHCIVCQEVFFPPRDVMACVPTRCTVNTE
jgi:hypothetical protein